MVASINLFIDKFRGIRAVNPLVDVVQTGVMSALSCSNVELKYSRNGNNVGIYTMKGNREISELLPAKEICGIWESVQQGVRHNFVYATDEEGGYLYEYKTATQSFELLRSGLSKTKVCNGKTIAQGLEDFFIFTNGVDDYLAVNLNAETEDEKIKELNAKDAENRPIRGLALEYYDGRLVTICKNRVHWSQQGNIFDWSAATTGYLTNAAYQEFDRDVKAIIYYNNTLIAFTETYSVCFTGNPAGSDFARSGSTGGGCAGFMSVLRFDNKLFYYDHFARNVFAYYLYDSGQTRPTDGLANDIKKYFDMIDPERLEEVCMQGFTVEDRTEIWFKLPLSDGNIQVMILDYLKNEWVIRDVSGLNAMMLYDGAIYTATGNKMYREYLGNSFNGEFRPAEYLMNIINVGSDSNLKIPKLPIIFTFDSKYANNFYIEFTYDDKPDRRKLKKISKDGDKFLIWCEDANDEEGGYWAEDENDEAGGIWGRDDSLNVTYSLTGTMPFKQLQMRIFTKEINEEFGIKRIEMKKVKVKTKTIM